MGGRQIIVILVAIMSIIILYLVYKWINDRKKSNNLSDTLILTGIGLITNSFSGWFELLYQGFIDPEYVVSNNILSLVTGFVILSLGIWSKSYFRKRLYVMNMFGPSKKRIRDRLVLKELGYDDLIITEREIDVVRMHESDKRNMYLSLKAIQDEIEEKVKTYIDESKETQRAFTGMSPTPITCLAGTYFLQHEVNIYLEYDRNDKMYKKIKKEKYFNQNKCRSYEELKRIDSLESVKDISEIIISISTTSKIQLNDMRQFENLPVLSFYSESSQDNSLYNYDQIMEYATTVCNSIEEVKESHNIQRIHLLIASQSALVLEIGRLIGMNENRYPEVVVYHYKHSGTFSYPYGLIVNGKNKGQAMIYEKGEQNV